MTHSDLWQQTLEQLQYQMSRATFDTWLAGSNAISLTGGTLTVHVSGDGAIDQVGRIARTIERTLAAVAGAPVVLALVNGSGPARLPVPAPAPIETPVLVPAPLPTDSPAALTLAQFDQIKNNWVKHPRYLSLFYHPYFMTFTRFAGSRALPVWQFIRDRLDDKKYDKAWTPVWEVLLKDLAELTGCSSQQLTGCWRPCPAFERARAEGATIPCCLGYGMVGQRDETACRYWASGVFQLLTEHGLAVIHQLGTAARNTRFVIQVYRRPALLTPWQVARLGSDGQRAHEVFLGELGIDVDLWRQIEVKSLSRVWRDDAGLSLATDGRGVLNAIAFKRFFLPKD